MQNFNVNDTKDTTACLTGLFQILNMCSVELLNQIIMYIFFLFYHFQNKCVMVID